MLSGTDGFLPCGSKSSPLPPRLSKLGAWSNKGGPSAVVTMQLCHQGASPRPPRPDSVRLGLRLAGARAAQASPRLLKGREQTEGLRSEMQSRGAQIPRDLCKPRATHQTPVPNTVGSKEDHSFQETRHPCHRLQPSQLKRPDTRLKIK